MAFIAASQEVAREENAVVAAEIHDETIFQHDNVDLGTGHCSDDREYSAMSGPTAEEDYTVFTQGQINFIALMASISTFYSPLTATIYFPALNTIADELGVSNTLVNLTVTTYMVVPNP